jgi:transcriptional regulator with XRE-family HTH domain
MPTSPFSSAQAARRSIAARLREIRLDAGFSGRELAARCGWHESKTSRIENAVTPPGDADIRAWCRACAAEQQVPDLIASSRTAESMYQEWKRLHRSGMRQVQRDWFTLYERSRVHRTYVSNVIPGFFQTAEYATALMQSITDFQGTPDDVAEAVEARLARGRFLHEGDHRFAVVIEEWALRCRIGSQEVMAGQLGWLLQLMSLPSVSLGIIPFTAQRTIWPPEAFYLFDDHKVIVETLTAELIVVQPREVADYIKAFTMLQGLAAYGRQARSLIAAAVDALE